MFSMFSSKGNELRVVNNYKYRKAQLVQRGQKWRCVNKFCNAHLFTDRQGGFTLVGNHAHEPCAMLPREFISNNLKKKAIEDIGERPSKLVHEEILRAPSMFVETLTDEDLVRIRRNLYRNKKYIKKKRALATENQNQMSRGATSANQVPNNIKPSPLPCEESSDVTGPERQEHFIVEPIFVNCKEEIVDPEESAASSIIQPTSEHGDGKQDNRSIEEQSVWLEPELVNIKAEKDRIDVFSEHIADRIRHLPSVVAQDNMVSLISQMLEEASRGNYTQPHAARSSSLSQ